MYQVGAVGTSADIQGKDGRGAVGSAGLFTDGPPNPVFFLCDSPTSKKCVVGPALSAFVQSKVTCTITLSVSTVFIPTIQIRK